jgi:hypothetical protein
MCLLLFIAWYFIKHRDNFAFIFMRYLSATGRTKFNLVMLFFFAFRSVFLTAVPQTHCVDLEEISWDFHYLLSKAYIIKYTKNWLFKSRLVTTLFCKPSFSIGLASQGFPPNIFIAHLCPSCVLGEKNPPKFPNSLSFTIQYHPCAVTLSVTYLCSWWSIKYL